MSEQQQIICAVGELYTKLTNNLENFLGKNGWLVISEMDLKEFVYCSHIDDLDIDIKNNCMNENIIDNVVHCACGKPHIKNLSVMSYPHTCEKTNDYKKYIIIGSDCVKKLEKFDKELSSIPNLKEKIEKWVEFIKEEISKTQKIECKSCGAKKILKNYKYTKKHKKFFCKKCLRDNQSKCIKCGVWRAKKLDYKGNPMLLCPPCYFGNSV